MRKPSEIKLLDALGIVNADLPGDWLVRFVQDRNADGWLKSRARTAEFEKWRGSVLDKLSGMAKHRAKRLADLVPEPVYWYLLEQEPSDEIRARAARRALVFQRWAMSEVTETGGLAQPLFAWLIDRLGYEIPAEGAIEQIEELQSEVAKLRGERLTLQTHLAGKGSHDCQRECASLWAEISALRMRVDGCERADQGQAARLTALEKNGGAE